MEIISAIFNFSISLGVFALGVTVGFKVLLVVIDISTTIFVETLSIISKILRLE